MPTRKSSGQFWLLCFLVGLTLLLVLPAWNRPLTASVDAEFLLGNAIIGVISTSMVLVESQRLPYSLKLVHWLFQYLFFFVAPLVQYLQGAFIWGSLHPQDVQLLHTTNYLILLWQGIWVACTLPAWRMREEFRPEHRALAGASGLRLAVLFALSAGVLVYLHSLYGWSGLLARGARGPAASSQQFALTYATRAIPVVLLASVWLRWRRRKIMSNTLMLLAAAGLALACNFPTSTSRFWFGAMALGLFLTLFHVRRRFVVYAMLIGGNVVFPLLGGIRYATSLSAAGDVSFGRTFGANLITADYDAFSMLAYTWQYVQDVGTTAGHQLLTAVLFFVPRSVWTGKGEGSGLTVGEHLHFPFVNVSSPLPAEGLINFGVVGVVLFAVASAVLANRWDRLYWSGMRWWLRGVYPFLLGFWFLMLRGDLLSSTAYTVGFAAVFILFSPRQRTNESVDDGADSVVASEVHNTSVTLAPATKGSVRPV